MATNDPTDSGGLFVGKRPGTGTVAVQAPGRRAAHGAATTCSRTRCWRVELVLCLSLFGPQPYAWLWIGSQVQYQTGFVMAGIGTILLGCLASLLLTMAAAKRVDHAWKLVRRAAGYDQERGRARAHLRRQRRGRGASIFGFWFMIIQGPAPTFAPGGQ